MAWLELGAIPILSLGSQGIAGGKLHFGCDLRPSGANPVGMARPPILSFPKGRQRQQSAPFSAWVNQ